MAIFETVITIVFITTLRTVIVNNITIVFASAPTTAAVITTAVVTSCSP